MTITVSDELYEQLKMDLELVSLITLRKMKPSLKPRFKENDEASL